MTIEELKQKLTDVSNEMQSMNDLCTKEDRDFTDEEQVKYDELNASLDSIEEEIKAEEKAAQERVDRAAKLKERQNKLNAVNERVNKVAIPTPLIHVEEPEEFKSLHDFITATVKKVLYKIPDNRLAPLYSLSMNDPHFDSRAIQSMGEGTAGGYMVPTRLMPELRKIAIQAALIRPRARVISAGDPPDAEITLPVLNQSSSGTGGVTVVHEGEGDTMAGTSFALKEVALHPHQISGYIDVTDKLLQNWVACAQFVEDQLKDALTVTEDTDFLSGNGVNKAKGITNQNCAITVTRNTASSIVYADIRKMVPYVLRRNGAQPIWFLSPSGLESLLALADPGSAGTLIFQPSAREGIPFTLMGMPLIINERGAAVGSKGDLMLLNLAYYLIKDGSGPFIAASPHVNFKSNKTCIRLVWNVDGDSWVQDKFPLEGDSSHYLSPFVILE